MCCSSLCELLSFQFQSRQAGRTLHSYGEWTQHNDVFCIYDYYHYHLHVPDPAPADICLQWLWQACRPGTGPSDAISPQIHALHNALPKINFPFLIAVFFLNI